MPIGKVRRDLPKSSGAAALMPLERWIKHHATADSLWFNPPATAEEIAVTEAALGVTLPDEMKQLYLRHDGQQPGAPWLLYGWEWLSLERIRSEWKVWKELLDSNTFDGMTRAADGEQVRADWWNAKWIPFTYSGSGDHHCVDLAPGPEGRVGQIIEMWHDDGVRPVVAPDILSFFNGFVADLQAGRWRYLPDEQRFEDSSAPA